ncbi:MAG: S46 family peptidase [Ignavibacteriaceae bacterium]|nr:S46 family peptidase [Ignavibacteriaceae bacterium]
MKFNLISVCLSFLLLSLLYNNSFSQSSNYFFDPDTVTAQRFDMGKMWTFENPPLDYFKEEYGFLPSEEWLEKVRKSALKFDGGCTASFISEDGLIMTNHHCIRGNLPAIQKEEEDLLLDGFYAQSLEQERLVPGLFVEQLIIIEDVTGEIKMGMADGKNENERVALRDKIITDIENRYSKDYPDLRFEVTPLYDGGRYSLYGYKRYNDVRLVFVPELWTAKLGGDYDNFTYPRYGLDCAFFRAYDQNGKPIKTDYYFKWSENGPLEDEPIFVIGNPGRTDRINTIAQIEFARDIQYPMLVRMFKDMYAIQEEIVMKNNAEDMKQVARLYSIGNGLKVYDGIYKGLLDPYLIARKKDFEKKFKEAINSDDELKKKYSSIWNEIEDSRKKASAFASELFAYNISSFYSPQYLSIARDLLTLAEQMKLEESARSENYKAEQLEKTIERIFPANFDKSYQDKLVSVQVNIWTSNLPADNLVRKEILKTKTGKDAVEYLLNNTKLFSKDEVIRLAKGNPDDVLNSDDPFIQFVIKTRDRQKQLADQSSELQEYESLRNELLGEALHYVYGDNIPPDATFTLRIADGKMKSYSYNGTVAPLKTTFYGSLDRYYSFDGKFPFKLPERFKNLPPEFDLKTPLNFISTNDIVGGNSGSAVINKNAEIVGLAFDGNIESLPGNYIYLPEANRTVSVHSQGMIEAIMDLYKAYELGNEILAGKRTDKGPQEQ